jgi:hypothetical protein
MQVQLMGLLETFEYLPANLSKYSMVNQEMQMASMRANFGLSMASPSALRC